MKLKNHTLFIVSSTTAMLSLANYAFAKSTSDFDANKNGVLERQEFIAFYLSELSVGGPKLHESDRNGDGIVSEEEFQAWLQSYGESLRQPVEDAVEDATGDFEAVADGRPSLSFREAEFAARGRPQPQANPASSAGFRLRRDLSDVAVDVTSPERVVDESDEGALISFNRDLDAGGTVVQAVGSLYSVIPLQFDKPDERPAPGMRLRSVALIPSLSFDITESSEDDADDGSSLTFRLAGQGEVRQTPLEDQFLAALYPRLGIAYATDLELDSDVLAAEVDIDPVLNISGNHINTPLIPGLLQARWTALLHSESGYTINAGDDTSLEEDEWFLRIGPKLRVDLVPDITAIENWRLSFAYDYLWGTGGTSSETSLLETSLSYTPSSNSPVELTLSYRKGDTLLLDYEVDQLTLGIGVKF